MAKFIDLSGKRFGRWTVQHAIPREIGQQNLKWKCLCDCGEESNITGGSLKNGISTSCGCLRSEKITERNTTHGLSNTREYHTWASMHRRCDDPTNVCYEYYGGRGISVCKEWESFEQFLQDMGKRPEGCSIDRVDNDGNYSKQNCRWATSVEQMSNTSRSLYYTVKGVIKTQAEWARIAGISAQTLAYRVKAGWCMEQACTAPKHTRKVTL